MSGFRFDVLAEYWPLFAEGIGMTLKLTIGCVICGVFLGMLLGAAAAHNFGLVGAAAKAATETEAAVPGGPSAAGKIAVIVCIVVLFVIAGTNLRRKKAAR